MKANIITKSIDVAGMIVTGILGFAIVGAAGVASYIFNKGEIARTEMQMEHEEYIMQHPEEHAMYTRLEAAQEAMNKNHRLENSLTEANNSLRKLNNQINNLNNSLAAKNKQISDLKTEVSSLKDRDISKSSDRLAAINTIAAQIEETDNWETSKIDLLNRLIEKV